MRTAAPDYTCPPHVDTTFQHVQPTPRPTAPSRDNTRDIGGPPYRNDSSSSSPTQHNLLPPPSVQHAAPQSSSGHSAPQSEDASSPEQMKSASERIPPEPGRRPPSTPILVPAYRYCEREGLIKPLRAHHCKACGKVCVFNRKTQHAAVDAFFVSVYSNTIIIVLVSVDQIWLKIRL